MVEDPYASRAIAGFLVMGFAAMYMLFYGSPAVERQAVFALPDSGLSGEREADPPRFPTPRAEPADTAVAVIVAEATGEDPQDADALNEASSSVQLVTDSDAETPQDGETVAPAQTPAAPQTTAPAPTQEAPAPSVPTPSPILPAPPVQSSPDPGEVCLASVQVLIVQLCL